MFIYSATLPSPAPLLPRARRRGRRLGIFRVPRRGIAAACIAAAPVAGACGIVALASSSASAQAVAAIDDEALTLPPGVFRLGVSASDTRYSDRYGTGGLQSLGTSLSLDSLGVSQLPILAPLQTSLRALTQDPTLNLTLGATQVQSSVRIQATPISLDIGITRRLTLHAIVPIVQTHDEIFFNPNPGGKTGNVGFNPALGISAALAIDTGLFGQFSSAGASLEAALTACRANPGHAAYCPALNAQSAAATALITQSSTFASQLSKVYGGDGHKPGVVVPVDSSAPWTAITGRFHSLAAAYAHFDSLTGGPGINSQGPVGAPPLGLGDAQMLLTSDVLGLGFDSLQSVDFVHIGDIELGATILLLDSFHGSDSARLHPSGFNYRLAATGIYRLGTGGILPEDALVGAATGTGANAIEVHAASDLLFGRHFWASILVKGTMPMADRISARIPLGLGEEFTPDFADQTVGRTLGRTVVVEIDPRYTISNYFGISTQYQYIQHSADQYTGVVKLDSAVTGFGPVTLNANTLGAGTATTEQRWGVGLTFSTLVGSARHPTRLPFDMSYFHYQTITGSAGIGGFLPKQSTDLVQIRIYVRFLGSGGAFGKRVPAS